MDVRAMLFQRGVNFECVVKKLERRLMNIEIGTNFGNNELNL